LTDLSKKKPSQLSVVVKRAGMVKNTVIEIEDKTGK
jgi:hypothetical protein